MLVVGTSMSSTPGMWHSHRTKCTASTTHSPKSSDFGQKLYTERYFRNIEVTSFHKNKNLLNFFTHPFSNYRPQTKFAAR